MSLKSIKKEKEIILLDTGWKNAQGNGSVQTLEQLNFDVDSVIHVFAKYWQMTTAGEWYLDIPYNENGNITTFMQWRDVCEKQQAPLTNTASLSNGREYRLCYTGYSSTGTSDSSVIVNNANGFSLNAGLTARFRAAAAAVSTDGITYRIIAERATTELMLER